MKYKNISLTVLNLLVALTLLVWAAGASPAYGQEAMPAATIYVDSTTDPDLSDSRTCLTHTPCTLRRAVIQARGETKPVTIAFNIPTTDAGYNATLKIWKIQFTGISSAAMATLRYLNGNITIDGSTQPGGRTSGPKIILVGSGTGQNGGVKLGETATQNGNVLRGLGFQNFATAVYVNSDSNLIENNWFGLSDNGLAPYLRNNDPQDGSGSTGVALSDGVDVNTIQNNIFLGFDGVAAALRGEDTTFQNNYIGTNASGLIPDKQTDPGLICTPVDWLGGGGISMDGPRHIVQNNIIAGLRQEIFGSSTQPDAITVQSTCDNCVVQNNKIGLDYQNNEIGVCGQGIDLSNTEGVDVTSNTLVNTQSSAIFLNGSLSDANTLSRNLIRRSTPWLLPAGATKADDAIQRYSGLVDAFEFFNPAKITAINGTSVTGTAGTGSACPNCIVEIFLDDLDAITETLQYLGSATANASGNWSFTLPAKLAPGQGLRTTSTTAQYGTISGMNAGTTVGMSTLYMPTQKIYLPMLRR